MKKIMKKLIFFTLAALFFLCVSCERKTPFNVPGLSDFVDDLQNKFESVDNVHIYLNNPFTVAIQCVLLEKDSIIPDDLLTALQEYALSSVLDAYRDQHSSDDPSLFLLEFKAEKEPLRVLVSYMYSMTAFEGSE